MSSFGCEGGVLTITLSKDEFEPKYSPPKEDEAKYDLPYYDHNGDDDDDDSDDGSAIFRQQAAMKKNKQNVRNGGGGGGVRFGSVRVHKHEMTLGDNPGGKTAGPPVTLEWEVAESERFQNLDEFSMKYHGIRDSERNLTHHGPHVIEGMLRNKIAAQQHSAGSIRKLQGELYQIRQHRKKSAMEDPVEVEAKENAPHKGKGGGFSLFNFFHHKK